MACANLSRNAVTTNLSYQTCLGDRWTQVEGGGGVSDYVSRGREVSGGQRPRPDPDRAVESSPSGPQRGGGG